MAWEMLDGWNHAYCLKLSDYAFFYYNGKVVMDPWMKETKQELPYSKRIYFDMLKLLENLVRIASTGWQREITFHKDDAAKVRGVYRRL